MCIWGLEENTGFLGAAVTDSCEPPKMGAELRSSVRTSGTLNHCDTYVQPIFGVFMGQHLINQC